MSNQILETVSLKTKELLGLLAVKYNDVTPEYDEENNTVKINIQGEDLGILIGYHGKNLDSIKIILSLMINKILGHEHSVRVLVNVNDYSEKRTEQLRSMVENARMIMESKSKDSYSFPPMNAADRRIVHTIADELGLLTESHGEGRDRHVVVSKKNAPISNPENNGDEETTSENENNSDLDQQS